MSTNGDEENTFLIIVPFCPELMSIAHFVYCRCIRFSGYGLFFMILLFVFAWADAIYRVPTWWMVYLFLELSTVMDR